MLGESGGKTRRRGSLKKNLAFILRFRRFKALGFAAGAAYFFAYLATVGNLLYLPDASYPPLSFLVVEGWPEKVWKPVAPFVWEPIAAAFLFGGWVLQLSVPNILVAAGLAALIGLNMAVAAFAFSAPKICGLRGAKAADLKGFQGFLGAIPSFFTGFACCAPTFIIALGSSAASFTLGFIAVRSLLIPVSVVVLLLVLFWTVSVRLNPAIQAVAGGVAGQPHVPGIPPD